MESRVGPGAREAVFAQLADTGRAEQVAQRLTDGIVLGVLHPGERLPSEPELARRFGVALITVREGLGILRESGLVETRRGRDGGSFVVQGDAEHRSLITARLRALAQVELSDMAVYFGAILAAARSGPPNARRRATASGSARGSRPPTSAPRHPLAPTRAGSSSRSPCSASRRGSCASRSACRPSSAPCCCSASTTNGRVPRSPAHDRGDRARRHRAPAGQGAGCHRRARARALRAPPRRQGARRTRGRAR